ncbi:hypothetical protein JCM24511_07270 [Saitozyma sp. JCM 24511]|nr:hypothetical protein JCM24511_07270 [Saitozyma sp. JCM 24511]
MSRLQGHRKSQSTSALAVIAGGSGEGFSSTSTLYDRQHLDHRRAGRVGYSDLKGKGTEDERERQYRKERRSRGATSAGSGLDAVDEMDGRQVGMDRTGSASSHESEVRDAPRGRDGDRSAVRGLDVGRSAARGSSSRTRESGEDVRTWLAEVMSLRSSSRRRLSALRSLEKTLLRCCLSSSDSVAAGSAGLACFGLADFLDMAPHTPLLSLLMRHSQSLSLRAQTRGHSALDACDELAAALLPEMGALVGMLQGLCLLSGRAKAACGEEWAVEMIIDLLLLLRAQAPSPTSPTTPTPTTTTTPATTTNSTNSTLAPTPRPIVYILLELLCAVLVDSPQNARTFEKLSGLEAVVRVLKGSAVAKDVRMKCIEFLYFYLLPEQSPPSKTNRASEPGSRSSSASSSSGGSGSSDSSILYPPSPLDSSASSDTLVPPSIATSRNPTSSDNPYICAEPTAEPTSPAKDRQDSRERRKQKEKDTTEKRQLEEWSQWKDLDVAFVPQTPKKRPQPSLGYLTPSTRRVSTATAGSSTPGLPTVPGSPEVSMASEIESEGRHSSAEQDTVTEKTDGKAKPPLRRHSMAPPRNTRAAHAQEGSTRSGYDLPRSPAVPSPLPTQMQMPRSGSRRDVTAIRLVPPSSSTATTNSSTHTSTSPSPNPTHDPFALPLPRATPHPTPASLPTSTQSSTPSRGLPHSSTQPSLTVIQSSPRVASTSRNPSIRRVSKSPLVQSTVPEESPEGKSQPQIQPQSQPHPRSVSQHAKSKSLSSPAPPSPSSHVSGPRQPKIRHSRTQSHFSGLVLPEDYPPVPPIPSLPSLPSSRALSSASSHATGPVAATDSRSSSSSSSSSTSTILPAAAPPTSAVERTPSRARRAFPAELTRGLPPSASSPNLSSLLAPSRRVSVDRAVTMTTMGPPPPPPHTPRSRRNEKDALGLPKPPPKMSTSTSGQGSSQPTPTSHAVRSVEDKKALLGAWLGNVDALVAGVEKVNFWGSLGKN